MLLLLSKSKMFDKKPPNLSNLQEQSSKLERFLDQIRNGKQINTEDLIEHLEVGALRKTKSNEALEEGYAMDISAEAEVFYTAFLVSLKGKISENTYNLLNTLFYTLADMGRVWNVTDREGNDISTPLVQEFQRNLAAIPKSEKGIIQAEFNHFKDYVGDIVSGGQEGIAMPNTPLGKVRHLYGHGWSMLRKLFSEFDVE